VGAVATEYVLLLVAVALVIVTAVVAFGGVLADRYDESADCVATVSVDSPACP
jgi:Flp pilus assembly pilin Flp